ncbi:sugar transferase [Paludisphaera rhizosphaerae]|uniref:sugar transferase n=1 Tax=Paludisphaera rhizosphaerae TaxID=2711216 RepID=UPI0013ED1422|nr:sugar transferase [Paludisphaera rhizosphaerae]
MAREATRRLNVRWDSEPVSSDIVESYTTSKSLADRILAALILLTLSPLVLIIMLAVKLTSRGGAIYRQERVGLGGGLFVMYKIRTMVYDCERSSGICWSSVGDPRATPLGRLLRRTHLDELPQLWNIVRGEMSLVGPRPERPEIVCELEQKIPHYRQRLDVLPGLTGLAQILLPPDSDVDDVRRKLTYDLYYVYHCNLWLDLRILACTACFLGGIPFALTRSLFRVPDQLEVEGAFASMSTELDAHTQVRTA